MSTAVWSVQSALDVEIKADTTLAAKLAGKKTYDDGQVPDNAPLNYVTYGTVAEGPFDAFRADGNDGEYVLHIWATSKSVVASIYSDLERLFNAQPITVTGHGVLLVTTRLASVFRDPKGPMHGVVMVRVRTRAS